MQTTAPLTNDTVEMGMEVEVYSHPDVQPVPHQSETGTVVGLLLYRPSSRFTSAVGVLLDGSDPNAKPVWFPIHHLIARKDTA